MRRSRYLGSGKDKRQRRRSRGIAHEIKNPLSTLKINLKLAAEDLETAKSQAGGSQGGQHLTRALRKIAVIQREAGRLEQILEAFLRYFDRTEPQKASVDMNALVSDMVDFYSPQAQSHSITVRLGLSGEPLICRIDADMLKQVMLNLFLNAQQAISTGGELIVRTTRRKGYAQIQISDTGCGISPDKLPRIFDAYYSSRPGGSGLGLATARKIVEAHNGSISVDSEPGQGTSFTIELPLQQNE